MPQCVTACCWRSVAGGCGLGTKMVEEALVAWARIQLMQEDSPAHTFLKLAQEVQGRRVGGTWQSNMLDLSRAWSARAESVPTILQTGLVTDERLGLVRKDAAHRKLLLRQYRNEVVRPHMAGSGGGARQAVASVPSPDALDGHADSRLPTGL